MLDMLDIRRCAAYGATALVIIGCASAPQSEASVAESAAEPCAVRPADGGQWKQMKGVNFTFCVPVDWQKRGGQSWRGPEGTVTWSLQPDRQAITVRRMDSRPITMPTSRLPSEGFVETIGGVSVNIRSEITESGYELTAVWERSQVKLEGTARSADGAALCREIFRTVRLDPSDLSQSGAFSEVTRAES